MTSANGVSRVGVANGGNTIGHNRDSLPSRFFGGLYTFLTGEAYTPNRESKADQLQKLHAA